MACSGYCCSAFKNFQEDITKLPKADLDHEIHPLLVKAFFRLEADHGSYMMYCGQSLYLASQLLLSDELVVLICTMADGDVYLDHHDEGKIRRGRKIVDPQELERVLTTPVRILKFPKKADRKVNDTTRAKARAILNALVGMIKIELGKWEDLSCCDALNEPLTSTQRKQFPRGCKSVLHISRRRLERLRKAEEQGDHSEILKARFDVAKVVLHEFGHAIQKAAHGSRRHEDAFFKNSGYAEGGLAVEEALFGGIISSRVHFVPNSKAHHSVMKHQPLGYQDPLILWRAPFAAMCQVYRQSPKSRFGQRTKASRYTVAGRVPLSYIADLFTMRFWADRSDGRASRSLRPPTPATWLVKALDKSFKEMIAELKLEVEGVAKDHTPAFMMCELIDGDVHGKWRNWLKDIVRRQERGLRHLHDPYLLLMDDTQELRSPKESLTGVSDIPVRVLRVGRAAQLSLPTFSLGQLQPQKELTPSTQLSPKASNGSLPLWRPVGTAVGAFVRPATSKRSNFASSSSDSSPTFTAKLPLRPLHRITSELAQAIEESFTVKRATEKSTGPIFSWDLDALANEFDAKLQCRTTVHKRD